MRRFIVGVLAVIGVIALIVLVGGGIGTWWAINRLAGGPTLPDRFVLLADLRGSLAENVEPPLVPVPQIEVGNTVSDVVFALDRASQDGRVAGLVALLDDTSHGLAVAQELRQAVQRFRQSGRFALAYADSFGELTPGIEGYIIASAFEEITLQPTGLLGLSGLAVEMPFVKELLDDIGVAMDTGKRKEFKTVFDPLTEPGLTPANREMTTALVDDFLHQITQAVADGRGVDAQRAMELTTGGPYTAEQALDLGLVDRLGYDDEVLGEAAGKARTSEIVKLADYMSSLEDVGEPAATIAFVRAVGPIVRGTSEFGSVIAADDLAQALADAVEEPSVSAILLRINSPGGSAVASETVAHQIRRATEAGKPVVVSMGNVAASGGYWLAMGGSRILAQAGTYTGSIGVIAGKPVLADLWDRLEVNWATISRGPNAGMWSFNKHFDQTERATLDRVLDQLYGQFKAGVAKGRQMTPEEVEAVAKGRVWTGAQAVELGLVDRLGGLHESLEELRSLLGLPADAPLALEPYPAPETSFGRILDFAMHRMGIFAAVNAHLNALITPGSAIMPLIITR